MDMGGFGRGGEQFERRSSETRAEEIDKLWAWLVEKSHEDPAAAAGPWPASVPAAGAAKGLRRWPRRRRPSAAARTHGQKVFRSHDA